MRARHQYDQFRICVTCAETKRVNAYRGGSRECMACEDTARATPRKHQKWETEKRRVGPHSSPHLVILLAMGAVEWVKSHPDESFWAERIQSVFDRCDRVYGEDMPPVGRTIAEVVREYVERQLKRKQDVA